MKIGILGSGDVGKTLAGGFRKHGHEVMIGTRDPAKLADWLAKQPGVTTGNFAETAKFGEVLVLAVKGTVTSEALRSAGHENLAGKVVIDATNPIADARRSTASSSSSQTSTSRSWSGCSARSRPPASSRRSIRSAMPS